MTDTHIKIAGKHWAEAVRQLGGYSNLAICNKAIEIALAEQSAEQYITTEQARELGAGNAEFLSMAEPTRWIKCNQACIYSNMFKYRAIKQAQPEPSDPHAALRAEYIRQRDAVPSELRFYKWELQDRWSRLWIECYQWPEFNKGTEYRYTDISCMVALKGEPAKRMLRMEAQELQRQTKDTHDWFHYANTPAGDYIFPFDAAGTYTYAPKALKQPAWTGSREDVIALLKDYGLLDVNT